MYGNMFARGRVGSDAEDMGGRQASTSTAGVSSGHVNGRPHAGAVRQHGAVVDDAGSASDEDWEEEQEAIRAAKVGLLMQYVHCGRDLWKMRCCYAHCCVCMRPAAVPYNMHPSVHMPARRNDSMFMYGRSMASCPCA